MKLLSVLVAASIVAAAAAAGAQEGTIDTTVALVNLDRVTRSQVERRRAELAENPYFRGAAPSFEQALEFEIERLLILQAAKAEFDAQMRDYLRGRAAESVNKRRDPRAFTAPSKLTLETQQEYDALLIQAYVQKKVGDTISVTPAELRAQYESNIENYALSATLTIREILIRTGTRTKEEAEALARRCAERITAGEDFAAVAAGVSESSYAADGGLWPPQKRGGLVGPVEAVAVKLRAGEVSEPFASPLGWHVIKLEARNSDGYTPFTEVQTQIHAEIVSAKHREAERKLMSGLKAKAIIKKSEG